MGKEVQAFLKKDDYFFVFKFFTHSFCLKLLPETNSAFKRYIQIVKSAMHFNSWCLYF